MEQTMEHKKHRAKKAGPKAAKKQSKDDTARERNPRAFSIQSAVKAAKKFHRSQDVRMKKHHIPLPDRTVLEPPPVIVGIVGPPKVGKTTLLRCLVKNYTRQSITNIQGPVTVVSGKQRRLTFIECSSDVSHMIDIAKVADLVILMVDASFGFEMEVFEFLNILQVHGFPKVMGVLNHLDTFNDNKKTRKTKKRLKDRFWTEIYQGAKLFYLSGMIDGEYQKTEIHNLCRFISVMKFRPLTWRTTHPYILADRMEDITPPDEVEKNPKCDRRITLYGYNRGVALKSQQAIHIPGMGDFRVADIEKLTDPCPTPEMEKRRTLNQKERLIYAPMSGVGGILYDKDAVYIDVGGSHYFDKEESEEMTPVKELLSALMGPTKAADESDEEDSSDDESKMPTEQLFTSDGRVRRKAIFSDEKEDGEDESDDNDEEEDDSEEEEEEENEAADDKTAEDMEEGSDREEESEEEMDFEEEEGESGIDTDDSNATEDESQLETEKALQELKKRQEGKGDYYRMIYGESDKEEEENEEEDEDADGLLRVLRKMGHGREQKYVADLTECTRFPVASPHDWDLEEVREVIADCFVTGRWDKDEDCEARLEADDELYGDFEDLETGEKHAADTHKVESDDESDGEQGENEKKEKDPLEEKKRQKQQFDLSYDQNKHRMTDDDQFLQNWKRELEEQTKLNRAEFENLSAEMREKVEGYRPGLYLRVEVEGVPCEFIEHFSPSAPLVLGGLSNVEEGCGYIQTRFKKHRFFKNQLKTKNPMTVSLGWRRFQTLPIFSKTEDNMRQRMLKYTPPHIHCMASFWGPITPQGSGVLAVDSGSITHKFRICGTGVVLELDKSVEITKKLKLTGTPLKIMQKTAYIQGMFNSPLEVAKFEGATVKTVSGVRGIVKKPARRLAKTGQMLAAGTFRATFEDKILLSDIVFLTTWYPVEVPQFYNPSTSLLGNWQEMKTVGQLRQERGVAVPRKEDSLYRPVEHRRHKSIPLRVPNSLNLPFKLTPKPVAVEKKPVILEPEESKKAKFLHQLKVVHEFNERTKHAIMRQRAHKHSLQLQKRAAQKEQTLKNSKKEMYRQLGKMEKAKAARQKVRSKHSL